MVDNNVPVQPADNTAVAAKKTVEPVEVPMPQPEISDVEGGRTTASDTEAMKKRLQAMEDGEKADILRAMGVDEREIRKMYPSLKIPVTPMTTDEVPGPDAYPSESGPDANPTAEYLQRMVDKQR